MKKKLSPENRTKLAICLFAVLSGVFLYELLEHLSPVREAVLKFLRITAPILYGLALAYVLNLPMSFFERRLFKGLKAKNPKLSRAVSILMTCALFFGALALIVALIVPRVVESVAALIENSGDYLEAAAIQLDEWNTELDLSPIVHELLNKTEAGVMEMAGNSMKELLPRILKMPAGAVTAAYSLFISFVVSVHGLIKKERLLAFAKKTFAVIIKKPERFFRYCSYADRTFRRYISGQLASCLILGGLCYIGMRILSLPYPELISVYTFIMAFIPIIGPWVSTLSSAFIILMSRLDEPVLALWFVLLIIAIQQLDDNLIAPRLIGDAVGIPGILVLASIVTAGGLFGVVGLVVAVPAAAVGYKIYGEWLEGRD